LTSWGGRFVLGAGVGRERIDERLAPGKRCVGTLTAKKKRAGTCKNSRKKREKDASPSTEIGTSRNARRNMASLIRLSNRRGKDRGWGKPSVEMPNGKKEKDVGGGGGDFCEMDCVGKGGRGKQG